LSLYGAVPGIAYSAKNGVVLSVLRTDMLYTDWESVYGLLTSFDPKAPIQDTTAVASLISDFHAGTSKTSAVQSKRREWILIIRSKRR
jgi:hypothetical protein